jgi:hypothetical protein
VLGFLVVFVFYHGEQVEEDGEDEEGEDDDREEEVVGGLWGGDAEVAVYGEDGGEEQFVEDGSNVVV